MTPNAPFDTQPVDIIRREGDVSATLCYIAPGGSPANVGGWVFTFSVTCGGHVLTVTAVPDLGNASGQPINYVLAPGFTIPGFNSVASMPIVSNAGFFLGNFIWIQGFGVFQIDQVVDDTSLTIYNNGFAGNLANSLVPANTAVYAASNVGYAVLTIPASVTNWASPGSSLGRFPYYIKYTTTDTPGALKKTFAHGKLIILSQNDPLA